MEGRDIGTVVLPAADLKVFLTATAGVRARRRQAQLLEQGIVEDYEQILRNQLERDQRDSTRAVAPLRRAEAARALASNALSPEQIVPLREAWLQQVLRKSNH